MCYVRPYNITECYFVLINPFRSWYITLSAAAACRTQRINYCRRNASRITIWNRDFTRYDHERGITFSFALCSLSVPHARPFRTIALTVQITVHSKNGFKRDWVINLKLVANCRPFTERAKCLMSKWDNQFCHFLQFSYVLSLAGQMRRTSGLQDQSVHILMSSSYRLSVHVIQSTTSGGNLR